MKLTKMNSKSKVVEMFVYEVENPIKSIHLACMGNHLALEIIGKEYSEQIDLLQRSQWLSHLVDLTQGISTAGNQVSHQGAVWLSLKP